MPTRTLPSVSWSIRLSRSAKRTGWCSGMVCTEKPKYSRGSLAARYAANIIGSLAGGAYPVKWWSGRKTASKPSRSASTALATIASMTARSSCGPAERVVRKAEKCTSTSRSGGLGGRVRFGGTSGEQERGAGRPGEQAVQAGPQTLWRLGPGEGDEVQAQQDRAVGAAHGGGQRRHVGELVEGRVQPGLRSPLLH